MWVDDSANALLVVSFLVLFAGAFQLTGWWQQWWTPVMLGMFSSAIGVELWNYYAATLGSSAQVLDKAYVILAVVMLGFMLAGFFKTFIVSVMGIANAAAVVSALVWGYVQFASWAQGAMDWTVSFFVYVCLLLVVLFAIYMLGSRLLSWVWINRVLNILIVTFIITQAARVVDERDPYHGFDTTEIQVLDIDNAWLLEWLLMTAAYVVLYYLSYKHVPWHNDRHHDAEEKLYANHLKSLSSPVPSTPPPVHPHHHKSKSTEPSIQSLLYPERDAF